MRRSAFIASFAAAALVPAARARAQDDFDPASSAQTQSLRVLLGTGDAQPLSGGGFTFGGRSYRGTFTRTPQGEIVNLVSLEEYLYSVVAREMSPSWPSSALGAQAICARTYVLQRSNPRRAYDVVPSELDQVYSGTSTESPAGRAAVDATVGAVLRYGNAFAQIAYSSCCGGHTEASSDAWGGAPIPYLNGVSCPHCTASPNYRWERSLNLGDVAQRFARELSAYGALTTLALGASDASGRATTVELRCERGSAFVKGSTFRLRVGPRAVPSLLISRIDTPSGAAQATLAGGGLGHGVGLCQWGARGMALEGATAADILGFYFPGTTIGHD
ncbi:MAG: SpoIID/LytB domain-containing protein [bacterium]|nr:SpoIID/LytB domain-containing protein [bacterium]